MGNSQIYPNSQFAVHHTDPLHSLTYLQDPEGNEFVLREVLTSSQAETMRLHQLFQKRICLTHPHLAKLLSIVPDKDQKGAKMLSECSFKTLENERTDRSLHNDPFEEEQLWSILASLILVLSYLQRHGISLGTIRTSNIYLNSAGLVQVMDPLAKGYPSNYQCMLEDPFAEAYLSPNEFSSLVEKRPKPTHNPFKSDVYSLGMIMLELGLLESQQHIYQRQAIDFRELDDCLVRFNLKFSRDIGSIVEMMLQRNESSRVDWVELESFVAKNPIIENSHQSSLEMSKSIHENKQNRNREQRGKGKGREKRPCKEIKMGKKLEGGLFYEEDGMKQSVDSIHSHNSWISQSSNQSMMSQQSYQSYKSQQSQMSQQSQQSQMSQQSHMSRPKQPNPRSQNSYLHHQSYHSHKHSETPQNIKDSHTTSYFHNQFIPSQPSIFGYRSPTQALQQSFQPNTNHLPPSFERQSKPEFSINLQNSFHHHPQQVIVQQKLIFHHPEKSISSPCGSNKSSLSSRSIIVQTPVSTLLMISHAKPSKIMQHEPIVRIVHADIPVINMNQKQSVHDTPIAELSKLDKSIQMSGIHIPLFQPTPRKEVIIPSKVSNCMQTSDLNRGVFTQSAPQQSQHQDSLPVQSVIVSSRQFVKEQTPIPVPTIKNTPIKRCPADSALVLHDIIPQSHHQSCSSNTSQLNPSNPYKKKPTKSQKLPITYEADNPHQLIFSQPIGKGYTGEMKQGMRHGKGVYFHSKNGIYQGEWSQNKMNGYGKLYTSEGKIIYRGEWDRDHIHGKGILFNNKQKSGGAISCWDYLDVEKEMVWYEGEFCMDEKKGKGRVKLSSGDVFEGIFKGDKIEGVGVFRSKDSVVKGIWVNNRLDKVLSIE